MKRLPVFSHGFVAPAKGDGQIYIAIYELQGPAGDNAETFVSFHGLKSSVEKAKKGKG
jgi:hypothetical protein